MFRTNLARENWKNKYQYKEETPLETQIRAAEAIASVEENPQEWREKFLNVLVKFDKNGKPIGLKNTLGGRITANIGTEYSGATLLNCFINGCVTNASVKYERKIPGIDETIKVEYQTEGVGDNLRNIMLTLLEQAETLKSEGGYGINFGFIRPRGTVIKSIGIKHPGIVHYMEIWDTVANVIVMGDNDGYSDTIASHLEALDDGLRTAIKKQARKGAQMAALPVWHPDVEEFVRAKQEGGRLTKFNLSVLVDDAFLKAVENDDFYDLHFQGKVYKRVRAVDLYDLIMKSTYNRAEPGILFYDNMQKNNPLAYLGDLTCTNPSLRGKTLVLTKNGIEEIQNLVGKENLYVKNFRGEWHEATAFLSGKDKELYKIEFSDGSEIFCTKEHKWPIIKRRRDLDESGKRRMETRSMDYTSFYKVKTEDLKKGQRVYFPLDQGPFLGCDSFDNNDGFLLGWFCGGGWVSEKSQYGAVVSEKDGDVVGFIESEINKNSSTRCNFTRDHDTKCFKISVSDSAFKNKMERMGFSKDRVPETVFLGNNQYVSGFISGVFSSYGSFRKNGNRITLTNKSIKFLEDVRSMLMFYGIESSIRKTISRSSFSNGKDCNKEYTRFDLIISKVGCVKFSKTFQMKVRYKQEILDTYKNATHRGSENNKEFKSIVSVEKTEKIEDVYDITVFDDTHTFICEGGIVTGNCGEIGGNPHTSTVCLLGSSNLTQYVNDDRSFDWDLYKSDVAIFSRMLDNICDLTTAPLPQYEWAVKNIRQYGMGINGLGSALYMMGISYSGKEAEDFVEKITSIKEDITWKTSALLAKEKGAFPAYSEKFLETNWFKDFTRISEETKDLIRKYGVRNGKTTTNPPLGNSSVICDMVSNGIEPVYDKEYERTYIAPDWPEGLTKANVKRVLTKKQQGDVFVWAGSVNGVEYLYEPHNRGLCIIERVRDYGYGWVMEGFPEDVKNSADYFVTTKNLDVKDHVAIQSIVQRNCNQSVSKTANLPFDYSFDDFKSLYLDAWKAGLNGFTTYREGSMESVFSTVQKNNGTREIIKKDIKLPDEFINGPMSVIKREGMKFYFHFSYLPEDLEKIFPVALWLNTNSYGEIKEANAVVKTLVDLLEKFEIDKELIEYQKEKIRGNPGNQRVAKIISMCLRHNIPIVNIVHVLDRIPDIYVTDTIYAVKKFLSQHIEDGTKVLGAACSSCKSTNVVYTGGCSVCKDCGNSLCG